MIVELLRWRSARMRARLDLGAGLGLVVLASWLVAALLAPLSGYQPGFDANPALAGAGPSASHLLGTDHLGRDTFWRLLLAARAFVGPGLLACAVAAAIAVPAGAVAGWSGGWVAALVRYVGAVVASVPRFVLVLLALTIYGDGLVVLAVAAGISYVPALVEEIHGRIEALRADEYLVAAEAHGVPAWRVLWLHLVVGACGGLVARQLVLLFGYVLVLEATLSYLGGFGVQEPTPSWGNMLVFEWGRDGSWAPRLSSVVALWATVGATTAVARWVGGETHG